MSEAPLVSVIIPVRNASRWLKELLDALERQTWPAHRREIIFVDNGSTDGTFERLQWAPVTLLQEHSRPSPYVARNRGMEEAKGEIIAMLDANKIPDPTWLEEGVRTLLSVEGRDGGEPAPGGDQAAEAGSVGFGAGTKANPVGEDVDTAGANAEAEPATDADAATDASGATTKAASAEVDLVGGNILFDLPKDPGIGQLTDALLFNNNRHLVLSERGSAAGNLFFRRRVWDLNGPFPGDFRSGMDIWWTQQAVRHGYRLAFSEKAVVRCKPRDFRGVMRKAWRVGKVHPFNMRSRGMAVSAILNHALRTLFWPRLAQVREDMSRLERDRMLFGTLNEAHIKGYLRPTAAEEIPPSDQATSTDLATADPATSNPATSDPVTANRATSSGRATSDRATSTDSATAERATTERATSSDRVTADPATPSNPAISDVHTETAQKHKKPERDLWRGWIGVWAARLAMGAGRLAGLISLGRQLLLNREEGRMHPEGGAISPLSDEPSVRRFTRNQQRSPQDQQRPPRDQQRQAGDPSQKATIAYLYYTFYPVTGGASVHGYHLAKQLNRLGYRLLKVNGEPDPHTEKLKPTPKGLWRLLRESDLVYVRMDYFFNLRNLIGFLSLLSRKKTVVELNCPSDELILFGRSRRWIRWVDRLYRPLLSRAEAVIGVSDAVRRYAVEGLNLERVHVIENGGEVFQTPAASEVDLYGPVVEILQRIGRDRKTRGHKTEEHAAQKHHTPAPANPERAATEDKATADTPQDHAPQEAPPHDRNRGSRDPGKRPLVVWAGSKSQLQGAEWMRQVIEQTGGGACFVMMIRGPEDDSTEKLALEAENLFILHDLARPDVRALIREADIGLAFYDRYDWSRWGFYLSSLKIYEFLNNGLLTLTNIEGSPIQRSSPNLLTVTSPEEAANAILSWRGQPGRSTVRPVRTWEDVARETAAIFESILTT